VTAPSRPSLDRYRELLAEDGIELAEEDLVRLRDELAGWADFLVDCYAAEAARRQDGTGATEGGC